MFKKIFGRDGRKTLWDVIAIGLLQMASTCCTVGFSACLCHSLYLVLAKGEREFSSFVLPLSLGIAFILLTYIFSLLQDRVSLNTSKWIRGTLRRQVFEKALRLGTTKNHYMPHSELTTMALEGIDELDSFYTGFLPSIIYGLGMPLLLLTLCLVMNFTMDFASPISWVFGVSMVAILPFIPIMIGIMCMSIGRVFGSYWTIYLRMGSTFTDSLHGLSILKDFDTVRRKGEQLDGQSEEFRKITMKVLVTELVALTVLDLLSFGGVGSGMTIAIHYGVAYQNPSVWCVAIFLILIVFEFFIPMRNVAGLAMVAGRGVMAYKRISKYLNIPEEEWGEKNPSMDSIEISKMTFKYSDAKDEIAVSDISLGIGEKGLYGIVGESGSGKSTLAAILTGGLIPSYGSVSYGNTPLNNISRDWFFSKVGLLQGFSPIPAQSIRELFKFYDESVDDESMVRSMREFKLDGLLGNPQGLDYPIKEDSNNISVGERQRLILAASLRVHRDIWIFDEVSSALDYESRTIIDERIERLSRESIVLMISHRLVETKNASRIYVMSKGRIVESGTSEELLKKDGIYASMYRNQKGGKI